MVAIPILLSVALVLVALAPSLPPAQQLVRLLASEAAPQVASQKANELNSWAVNFLQGQHPVKPDQTRNVAQLNAAETMSVMIFNPAGQVVGSSPVMPARFTSGGSANFALFLQKLQINIRESQQVIQAAFANEQNLAKLVFTQADGQTLAAVPILDHQQHVSGVLFVSVRGLRNVSSPLSNLFPWLPQEGSQQLSTLLPYALLLILLVSVIGTVVGMLTARRITRRLQDITSAAHAWSIGDFHVYVSDRSPDELGQLAQDLNRMALQVQYLLNTRQQLTLLEERQRVARDLHDSVKQQAFALTLMIGAAQSRLPDDLVSAQGLLTKAGELADQIRQELTDILHQLRPAALVGQGLQAAVRDYVGQWSQQTGITGECQVFSLPEGSVVLALLHPEIEEALFRMVQEALANVARHSHASEVQVQLERGTDQVCLHVLDNGKGFTVEQAAGRGHGLVNMRDRMEAYGGTLHIRSSFGETVVTGCIPLVQGTPQQMTKGKERAHG